MASSSKELSVYIVTFNCARQLIDQDRFAAHLFDLLPPVKDSNDNSNDNITSANHENAAPDILVLSLQEVAPLYSAFLGGSLLVPYLNAFHKAVDLATCNRWPSSSTSSSSSPPAAAAGAAVRYTNAVTHHCGLTALMVFIRSDLVDNVAWIDTAEVGVGFLEMGNKGAVGARLGYYVRPRAALSTVSGSSAPETSVGANRGDDSQVMELTFVAAHYAPMEDAVERRNRDWRRTVERLVFTKSGNIDGLEDEDDEDEGDEGEDEGENSSLLQTRHKQNKESSMFSPRSHLFFAGDLNYRTSDVPPTPADYALYPQVYTSSNLSSNNLQFLEKDQLTRERRAKRTLHGLLEAPIEFPPTYKYSDRAQVAAASKPGWNPEPGSDQEWLWAKRRWPSWCDRILYLQYPRWMNAANISSQEEEGMEIRIQGYNALPLFPTSDHRAVALAVSIPLLPISVPPAESSSLSSAMDVDVRLHPPFSIDPAWRARRENARLKEVIVGGLAYLALTWEGNGILVATVVGVLGGWIVLRSLLGGELAGGLEF